MRLMPEWLRKRLVIDHWREAWCMWSVRLAALASAVVTMIVASPEILLNVLNQLPPEIRQAISPVIGIAIGLLVAMVRLWDQRKSQQGGNNGQP